MVGWLTDFTDWIADNLQAALDHLKEWMADQGVALLDTLLDAAVSGIEAIPTPDFLASNSIGGFLAGAGPEIAWVVGELRIAECVAMIAAAMLFRTLRVLLTLGFWR